MDDAQPGPHHAVSPTRAGAVGVTGHRRRGRQCFTHARRSGWHISLLRCDWRGVSPTRAGAVGTSTFTTTARASFTHARRSGWQLAPCSGAALKFHPRAQERLVRTVEPRRCGRCFTHARRSGWPSMTASSRPGNVSPTRAGAVGTILGETRRDATFHPRAQERLALGAFAHNNAFVSPTRAGAVGCATLGSGRGYCFTHARRSGWPIMTIRTRRQRFHPRAQERLVASDTGGYTMFVSPTRAGAVGFPAGSALRGCRFTHARRSGWGALPPGNAPGNVSPTRAGAVGRDSRSPAPRRRFTHARRSGWLKSPIPNWHEEFHPRAQERLALR